ncbi:MAG: YegS/Rv2252/BmrU family lipid kinase, partial [bacterium]|nr:YegS/Rv2252/BmrU family lipid kinase [bacterium]
LVVNPISGLKQGVKQLPVIITEFCNAGYLCTVYITKSPGEAKEFIHSLEPDYDIIVCVGGDGTLNEVVSGVVTSQKGVAIGYIPTGSTNDFASILGISKNIKTAVSDIINGTPCRIDVGSFNDRIFTYVTSFGAFTETSYSVPQNSKNLLGHFAYVLEGIKELPSLRAQHIVVKADDKCFEGEYVFGAISNSTSIGGLLKYPPNIVDLSDGMLEILLFKMPQNLVELGTLIQCINSKNFDNELIEFCCAKEISVYCDPDVSWTVDGEFAEGAEDNKIKNLCGAIRVIVPNKKLRLGEKYV